MGARDGFTQVAVGSLLLFNSLREFFSLSAKRHRRPRSALRRGSRRRLADYRDLSASNPFSAWRKFSNPSLARRSLIAAERSMPIT